MQKSLTKPFARHTSRRRGVVLMMMVVVIPALLILAGFAINISYMELARTDLQVATDAASRAACRTYAFSGDPLAAKTAAKTAATNNPVLGKVLSLQDSDIVFGASVRSSPNTKYAFVAGKQPYNSVRIDFQSASSGAIQLPVRMGLSNPNFAVAQTATATQADVDIVLVVDRSGSMAFAIDEIALPNIIPKNAPLGWLFGNAVPPLARWLDAILAVNTFLAILEQTPQQEFVGLATYSHFAISDVFLTPDYSLIVQALLSYSNPFNSGGTNIGDGIYSAIYNFQNSPQRRTQAVPVVIILTDGINNWGPNPIDAAKNAANENVLIYTITFSDEADQALMKQIAEIGQGKHYHATSAVGLQQAFQDIAGNLPVLLTE